MKIRRSRSLGEELVVELAAAADYDYPAVGENVVGGVPPAGKEAFGKLRPVGVSSGVEGADDVVSVVEAACLEEAAVGEGGSGGAPRVGEDSEWAEGVGSRVVLGRVGRAVCLEGPVEGVVAAVAGGEGEVGWTEVGAVKDYDSVVGEELHVHGGYSDAFLEEPPL